MIKKIIWKSSGNLFWNQDLAIIISLSCLSALLFIFWEYHYGRGGKNWLDNGGSKSPATLGNNTSVNKAYKDLSLMKHKFKQEETDYNNKYNHQVKYTIN